MKPDTISITAGNTNKLRLPATIQTQATGILGIRGSGKTNTAGVIVEELLELGRAVVVIDPLDVWWGLKSSADGEAAGFSVVIAGGSHADVPLQETDGAILADFVVNRQVPVVLSLRHLRKGAQRRFVTEFAEQLYHRKGDTRSPLLVVIDECDSFIPQAVHGGDARMVGAIEDLVRRGRSAGIGVCLISQRAASVNKDVLTQIELLIAHRHTSPQDRKALDEWIKAHDTEGHRDTFLQGLASLAVGTAWLWSPLLDLFEQVTVRSRKTFDSSATPKESGAAAGPKRLASVDLEEIRRLLAESVEEAAANDPKLLRARIAELEEQLAASREAPEVSEGELEARKLVQQIHRSLDQSRELLSQRSEHYITTMKRFRSELAEMAERLHQDLVHFPDGAERPDDQESPGIPAEWNAVQVQVRAPAVTAPRIHGPTIVTNQHGQVTLGKCERALLQVLAQHREGCEAGKLALLAGYRMSGGTRNSLASLRTAGLITGQNSEVMRITSAGLACGPFEPLPTGRALIQYWCQHPSLGKCERSILELLTRQPSRAMTADEICKATGYQMSGGTRNALAKLRTAGLIQGQNSGQMRASPHLFGSHTGR